MQPMLVPVGSKTSYIDLVPASHWPKQPDYDGTPVVDPDILDDGTKLETIADNTFDYVIAAHVLEHCDDAISALKTWVRVTKPGGHILIAVPDMRFCGEEKRTITSVDHFIRDHQEGPAWGNPDHYREVAIHHKGYSGQAVEDYVREAEPMIHFHTFTLTSFVQFLSAMEELGYELLEACLNVNEDVAVLKKSPQ